MTLYRGGQVHLLLNRCAHRGNQVCEARAGNSALVPLPVPRLDLPDPW